MLQEQERILLAEEDEDLVDVDVPKKSRWKRNKKRRYQNKLENWEKCEVSICSKSWTPILAYIHLQDKTLKKT